MQIEDEFKESQTNLTNMEIDLKEMETVLKKFSQMFMSNLKFSFSHTSEKVSPNKEDGVPYYMRKLVDFIKAIQNEMEKYGTGLTENIVLIEKMLDRISKTKKKQNFLFENCKKRINFAQNEFQVNKKKLSSKTQSKGKFEFMQKSQLVQEFDDSALESKNLIKTQMLGCDIEDLNRKENALFQNLKSAEHMIAKEAKNSVTECDSIRKKFIKKLAENLQDIGDKNVNLSIKIRKINEKYLGIKKLDEISLKSISSIIAKNELKLSKILQTSNIEEESLCLKKPPLNMKSISLKKEDNLISLEINKASSVIIPSPNGISNNSHQRKTSQNKKEQTKNNNHQMEEEEKDPSGFLKTKETSIIQGKGDNMDCFMERFNNFVDSSNSKSIGLRKSILGGAGKQSQSQQRIIPKKVHSRNSSGSSRVNPKSICSLSTRDEQIMLNNYDCYTRKNSGLARYFDGS